MAAALAEVVGEAVGIREKRMKLAYALNADGLRLLAARGRRESRRIARYCVYSGDEIDRWRTSHHL